VIYDFSFQEPACFNQRQTNIKHLSSDIGNLISILFFSLPHPSGSPNWGEPAIAHYTSQIVNLHSAIPNPMFPIC
jgi:hypothetical protein